MARSPNISLTFFLRAASLERELSRIDAVATNQFYRVQTNVDAHSQNTQKTNTNIHKHTHTQTHTNTHTHTHTNTHTNTHTHTHTHKHTHTHTHTHALNTHIHKWTKFVELIQLRLYILEEIPHSYQPKGP